MERSLKRGAVVAEARGGSGFPQVSAKGYRGLEKRGLVILPPFYMESRLTFSLFSLKYSFQAGY